LQGWVTGEGARASDAVPTAITGPHIGMDESGKGDWFGPLVVAAVYVDEHTVAALHSIGVRDSKDLSPTAIQRIAGQIERIVPPSQRHVWAIEPEVYNQLYAEQGNVNVLLAEAYAQVAEEVWQATDSTTIVCDQFSQRADRLEGTFAARGLPCPVQQHKAESASVAVAAASILASADFVEALSRLGQEAGLDVPLPKGSSDSASLQLAAKHILSAQGKEALGCYAKLHFKPIRSLLGEEAPAAARPGTQPHHGPPVTIQAEMWMPQYHPAGFWRFIFADGGILDWYEDTTGRLDVRGKPGVHSYQVLMEKAHGRIWRGDREAVEKSINSHIPHFGEASVPSVLGVGWQRRETVLGARFDFTDGGVLNYYRGKDTLTIQGTPSPLTRAALEALPSPFWAGLDELTDTLKQLFPDWRLGEPQHPDEVEGIAVDAESWSPQDRALDWHAFWPEDKEMRQAANQVGPCQRAMVEDWASVLAHHQGKRHLLVHAPTGLGKTLAALVSALAWVVEDSDRRRIYYLVNRLTQHENPLRELRDGLAARFEAQTGQPLRVVDLVGRNLMCDHPRASSLPGSCRHARDTADFSMLPEGIPSWREVKEHLSGRACPYHTLQGLMSQAHVVICDYWWLFSPLAQAGAGLAPPLAEQAGFSPQDSIVIVDEAHNLVPRVRSWLDVEELADRVGDSVRHAPPGVRRCLAPVLDTLNNTEPDVALLPLALLAQAGGAAAVQSALAELALDDPTDTRATIPERILRLLLHPDEAVIIYPTEDFRTGERRLIFRLVDPTPLLQVGYSRVHASLSMSGTLAGPSDYSDELRYQVPLFGLPLHETLTRKYASPFPLRNQRWIYCTDTEGTYRKRGNHLTRYAEHIVNISRATPGVTAVFFSSYAFLEMVRAGLPRAEQSLIVTEARADAQADDAPADLGAYEAGLRQLVADHGRAFLFAVYQGKLAEGANFTGNLVKTIICVSIPMEYPALFHQRLETLYAEHFVEIAERLGDDQAAKAHEYALDRVSLSLVLQACGRGIRSETDRCDFVLLDKRYHKYGWRRFLQPRPYNVRRPEENTQSFHQEGAIAPGFSWDLALLRSTGRRVVK
jgi:ribonuclease HIII